MDFQLMEQFNFVLNDDGSFATGIYLKIGCALLRKFSQFHGVRISNVVQMEVTL